MATLDTRLPRIDESLGREVTQLDEVAQTIRNSALNWAASGMGPFERGLELVQSLNHAAFVDRFKYGMAKASAQAMAASDRHVQAVYLYDAGGNAHFESGMEKSLDVSIHLLVLVEKPSAALEAFIAALDRALVASCRQLPSDLLAERKWILDVKLLTERDVQDRRGYACLLRSTFAPALQVWRRKD